MLPGIISGMASAPVVSSVPATVTYIGVKAAATSSNTNVGIGTAATDRYVVIALATSKIGSTTVPNHSSVTVAGTSCTKIAEATDTRVTLNYTSRITLWITNSPITSGTTATVALSLGSPDGSCMTVYTLNGISSPTAYNTATATGGATISSTINYPLNGVLVAMNSSPVPYTNATTWTGATLDVSSLTSTDSFVVTSASKASLTALTGQTIQAAVSSGPTSGSTLIAATWSPA